MSDYNGDYVKQRELNRLIQQVGELEKKVDKIGERLAGAERQITLLERLDLRIERLDRRLSQMLEKDLPAIQMDSVKLSTKTKVIWGIIVTVGSGVVTLLFNVVKSILGI